MLSISKMSSGQGSYSADLAREDYYLEGGEPLGVWWGRGSRELGLQGVVGREQLGECVATIEALAESARRWMSDPALRVTTGQRARAYVRSRHDPGVISDRLAAIFDRQLARRRPAVHPGVGS